MLKMALFDCASNEKCCSVDVGRGICPLFSSPPRGGLTTQESPPPGICHPRQKKIQTVDSAIQRLNNRSQTAVVQTLYSAIHGMNHYPLDSAIGFFNTYLLDSGLSAG